MPSIQPQCSTQSAWKQCGARHARLNRVKCTVARRFAQSTSEWPKTLPRGFNGGRSPLGLSFSPIFLQTKKDGATGGRESSSAAGKNVQRKMEPPEGVGLGERLVKNVQRKISPPEVVGLVERLVKNVQRKMEPPEGVGLVERLVKNVQRKISPPEGVSKRECR